MRLWTIMIGTAVGCLAAAPGSVDIPSHNLEVTLNAMPLYTARQELLLARSRVLEDDYTGAIAPLQMAARALVAYQNQEGGPNGETAAYMRQQILDYAGVMPNQDYGGAVSHIDDWLTRIRGLCPNCQFPSAGLTPPNPWHGPPT